MRAVFFTCFVIMIGFPTMAQNQWGGKLGLSLQFGTHYQKLGAMYQLYYYNNFMQVGHGAYVHYALKNLGPKGGSLEISSFIDVQGHWGERGVNKYVFNEFSNLSPHQFSAGYSLYIYLLGNETSQTAGAVHFTADQFQLAIHNDALGLNQIDDKFRTGGFYLGYQVDSALYSVQNTLWTGKSSDAPKIELKDYPSKDGCKDPSTAKYGNYSHGILALRVDYYAGYKQTIRGEIGIDAERIRHIFQNKFMHDGILPLVVKSDNPHYPMLQQDGSAYYFLEGQKVRKPKPYLQLSSNQMTFY